MPTSQLQSIGGTKNGRTAAQVVAEFQKSVVKSDGDEISRRSGDVDEETVQRVRLDDKRYRRRHAKSAGPRKSDERRRRIGEHGSIVRHVVAAAVAAFTDGTHADGVHAVHNATLAHSAIDSIAGENRIVGKFALGPSEQRRTRARGRVASRRASATVLARISRARIELAKANVEAVFEIRRIDDSPVENNVIDATLEAGIRYGCDGTERRGNGAGADDERAIDVEKVESARDRSRYGAAAGDGEIDVASKTTNRHFGCHVDGKF